MGANYRMTELQSALGRVALERFPAQVAEREEMIAYMDEALSEVPGVRVLPRDPRQTTRSFYRYIFAIDPEVYGFDHEVVCCLPFFRSGLILPPCASRKQSAPVNVKQSGLMRQFSGPASRALMMRSRRCKRFMPIARRWRQSWPSSRLLE